MYRGCLLSRELTSPCTVDKNTYINLTQLPANGGGLLLPRQGAVRVRPKEQIHLLTPKRTQCISTALGGGFAGGVAGLHQCPPPHSINQYI